MKKEFLLNLPEEKLAKIKEETNRGPNALSVKEKIIIALRLGLMGGKQHTLNEIGEMLGITRERVRQIEKNIIKKI